uniref:Uncharacterized protein n=1 Tax=uncultured marine virus TaxID=186617 RepID=A0A0F7L6R9_9VIRU|nr:hypothetical protein [uncultured marine virus]
METPQLSRSQLLSRAIHRWWEIRSNRGLYPALQYQIRLGSVLRYAISIDWVRLADTVSKEMKRAKKSHEALQKGTIAFAKRGGPKTDFVGIAGNTEDPGAYRDHPDVWPGGGPVHPDDR